MKRFYGKDRKLNIVFRLIFMISVLFLLNACSKESPAKDNLYAERIAIPRQRAILQKKQLTIGVCENADQELSVIKNKLAEHGFSVMELHTDSKEETYPLLRSGRIDLIAGKLTDKEIRSHYFEPVTIIIGDKEKTVLHYAVRRDDILLFEIFKAPINPKEEKNGKNTSESDKKT